MEGNLVGELLDAAITNLKAEPVPNMPEGSTVLWRVPGDMRSFSSARLVELAFEESGKIAAKRFTASVG
jgi:hypothetical protein